MGQKVNPVGIRLGITRQCESIWFAERDFADNLIEDEKIRRFIRKEFAEAAVSRIEIERPAKNALVRIFTARPGVIIGQKGKGIEVLRQRLMKIASVPIHVEIKELAKPELSARLVAETIARQLEQRVMFRRAMKRAVSSAMRAGAKGVKINVAGRLGGAEIARTEWQREGRVPLHTFRAEIDYALAESHTTYGVIGVKVWIFKGEHFRNKMLQEAATTVETL
jgi:small subunit ribosomal protein S3